MAELLFTILTILAIGAFGSWGHRLSSRRKKKNTQTPDVDLHPNWPPVSGPFGEPLLSEAERRELLKEWDESTSAPHRRRPRPTAAPPRPPPHQLTVTVELSPWEVKELSERRKQSQSSGRIHQILENTQPVPKPPK